MARRLARAALPPADRVEHRRRSPRCDVAGPDHASPGPAMQPALGVGPGQVCCGPAEASRKAGSTAAMAPDRLGAPVAPRVPPLVEPAAASQPGPDEAPMPRLALAAATPWRVACAAAVQVVASAALALEAEWFPARPALPAARPRPVAKRQAAASRKASAASRRQAAQKRREQVLPVVSTLEAMKLSARSRHSARSLPAVPQAPICCVRNPAFPAHRPIRAQTGPTTETRRCQGRRQKLVRTQT